MGRTSRSLSPELVKSLSEFYHRNLIQVPIIKRFAHASLQQRSGLKAATLELDTAAHSNIEYVAGTRLSVYPINSEPNVQFVLDYLIDDLATIFQTQQVPSSTENTSHQQTTRSQVDANYNSPFWVKFVQQYGRRPGEALRLALTHFVDLTSFPSRELLRYIGECCSHKAQRMKLDSITSSEDSWEHYICQEARTLRTCLEEFSSCKRRLSAKRLIIQELVPAQQPRLYSISNIKSSKRFRAEIIVVQHRFSARQIALNIKTIKEHERELVAQQEPINTNQLNQVKSTVLASKHPQQQQPQSRRSPAVSPNRAQANQQARDSQLSSNSIRSVRSMAMFSASPIANQQVRRLPLYSGPLMSLYAASNAGLSQIQSNINSLAGMRSQQAPAAAAAASKSIKSISPASMAGKSLGSSMSLAQRQSLLSMPEMVGGVHNELSQADMDTNEPATSGQQRPMMGSDSAGSSAPRQHANSASASNKITRFDGLCSNYLLNLQAGDQLLCEFVENPRFTLKGNRERPIMLIGQDVGVIAFRAFWQQRQLEHDRAQVFYTMFKDLSPKKFGDMQLVCMTGNKCRIEELFRREINAAQTSKILSSISYINRKHLISLLDLAANKSKAEMITNNNTNNNVVHPNQDQLQIQAKDLLELGQRIYKLLVENNGCLYTCCDPHMTQAIEILIVEAISRHNKCNWTRDQIMSLLPHWKGRKERDDETSANSIFQLENTFERAHIVQEIYDSSI